MLASILVCDSLRFNSRSNVSDTVWRSRIDSLPYVHMWLRHPVSQGLINPSVSNLVFSTLKYWISTDSIIILYHVKYAFRLPPCLPLPWLLLFTLQTTKRGAKDCMYLVRMELGSHSLIFLVCPQVHGWWLRSDTPGMTMLATPLMWVHTYMIWRYLLHVSYTPPWYMAIMIKMT